MGFFLLLSSDKPQFSNDTEIITREAEDGEIILNCTAAANPPSEYTWDGPNVDKEVKLSDPLRSVSHSGTYTCTASNQYGTAKRLFIIKRKREYQIFLLLSFDVHSIHF